MMNEYPAMLRLKGKKAIVVGGGRVAERKIKSLLEAEAAVTVISPEVTPQIDAWAKAGDMIWIKGTFRSKDDMQSAFLVIAATNDRDVNNRVLHAASPMQLVNIVDNPEESNFIVPSSFKQGRLTIAISTSGASPALAGKMKRVLAQQFDESYGAYIDFLAECRKTVKKEVPKQEDRKVIFKKLLDEPFLQLTRSGDVEERRDLFQRLLKESITEQTKE